MAKLQVGQTLYVDFNTNYHGRRVPQLFEIVKVGRKWAYLKGETWSRIDVKTLQFCLEENRPTGQAYLTEAELRQARRLVHVWRDLRMAMAEKFVVPVGVTADNIKAAAALLGLRLEERT